MEVNLIHWGGKKKIVFFFKFDTMDLFYLQLFPQKKINSYLETWLNLISVRKKIHDSLKLIILILLAHLASANLALKKITGVPKSCHRRGDTVTKLLSAVT